jgi:transcriptional regulator GlxA family with amidase domain
VGATFGAESARSLRRKMQLVTGAPLRYWLGLARVRRAAREIVLTDAALADVALETGFADQAHMTREVKRWLGEAPSILRSKREQVAPKLLAPDAFSLVSRR